ncbi:MAG: hypothetical protein IMW90_13195 [Thermogemmatispora sp.]|jgi:hypothetical protein|uniref:Uncharacterized protein n=1 Tax=Thermogemmatispora aurantia TaxID=2045279 RepID=A0A5J4K8F5_9CHLR|nr:MULTISPECIES: hypothetical protein [Thermogemmatispora]MBE3566675.1 hypothetical protein [Thermogemmatispora sp.]GER84894.1 hypothetical protein KTAU_35300 [Thermogemmatispora aurantia]
MASDQSRQQQGQTAKPLCPRCHKEDLVKTSLEAYRSGISRLAPPPMPGRQIHMINLVGPAVVLVGLAIFFIFVVLGEGVSGLGGPGLVAQVIITLLIIVAALVVSFIAFQRVVKSDAEATLRYPAWDRALENWRHLYYCSRDDLIFDGQQGKVVSEEALKALLRVEAEPQQVAQQSRSAAAPSHS